MDCGAGSPDRTELSMSRPGAGHSDRVRRSARVGAAAASCALRTQGAWSTARRWRGSSLGACRAMRSLYHRAGVSGAASTAQAERDNRVSSIRTRARGTYAPLSSVYYWDDRIDEVGPLAELLFVRGLAFCAQELSDGFISDSKLRRQVAVGLDAVCDVIEQAKRLVAAELWVRDDSRGGYVVRSWLAWNRSRDEIDRYRQKDATRKRASRPRASTSRDVRSDSNRRDAGIPTPDTDTDADTKDSDPEGSVGILDAMRVRGSVDRGPSPVGRELSALRERLTEAQRTVRTGRQASRKAASGGDALK